MVFNLGYNIGHSLRIGAEMTSLSLRLNSITFYNIIIGNY